MYFVVIERKKERKKLLKKGFKVEIYSVFLPLFANAIFLREKNILDILAVDITNAFDHRIYDLQLKNSES